MVYVVWMIVWCVECIIVCLNWIVKINEEVLIFINCLLDYFYVLVCYLNV